MKSIKSIFSVLFFVLFFSLVFIACKNTSEEGSTGSSSSTSTATSDESVPGKSVSFSYAIPSLIQQLNTSASEAERFTPDQILRGSLYVLNTDDSTDTTYDWTIYLDESDYSAQSNKTIILDPGNYEFSLLLTAGTRQYAGNAVQAIIDGENDVAMTIRPVIGDTITDVTIIDRIFDLRFQYDTAELTGITTPQLGVLIDSVPTENLLTIDPGTGLTNTYISLDPGTHTLTLKFYDGATQRGRSIPAQESVNIALGNSYTMDIVALQGETTFTLTEDGGDADFKFNIPSEVVEETGDTSNLQVLFSIVSPKNPLREIVLTVDASGDSYYAEETLADYQYDTVSFTLTFTQLSDSKQIGECINPGIVLDTNTETVNCEITLRRDGIIGGNLLATLGTNVMNTAGEPVAGAIVYANEEMIGITGSGTFGTPGYLRTFLVVGTYLVRAENTGLFAETSISPNPLSITNVELELSESIVWLGSQQFGTTGSDVVNDIAVDSSDNTYITGYTDGSLIGAANQGLDDIFLMKVSPSGLEEWTQQIGTSGYDSGMSIVSDSTGNVYITGATQGDLDGISNQGNYDIFLMKFNATGEKQWTQMLGTTEVEYPYALASDSSGNLYITGYTQGGLDGNTFQGVEDIFLTKFDSSGNKQWTRQLGTASRDQGRGVSVDNSGNIYVTGYTLSGLDGNVTQNEGAEDIFLVKYDSAGNKQWTKQMGTTSTDRPLDLTLDKNSESIYIVGFTNGNLDGNPRAGDFDLFLVKYNTSGVKEWTRELGSTEWDEGQDVVVDNSGDIYIAGYTRGVLAGHTSQGYDDLILVKYNPSGDLQWTQQFGSTSYDSTSAVTLDNLGNIVITGATLGGINGHTHQGSNDIFLIKTNSNGVIQ